MGLFRTLTTPPETGEKLTPADQDERVLHAEAVRARAHADHEAAERRDRELQRLLGPIHDDTNRPLFRPTPDERLRATIEAPRAREAVAVTGLALSEAEAAYRAARDAARAARVEPLRRLLRERLGSLERALDAAAVASEAVADVHRLATRVLGASQTAIPDCSWPEFADDAQRTPRLTQWRRAVREWR